jgi:hypothetical protein
VFDPDVIKADWLRKLATQVQALARNAGTLTPLLQGSGSARRPSFTGTSKLKSRWIELRRFELQVRCHRTSGLACMHRHRQIDRSHCTPLCACLFTTCVQYTIFSTARLVPALLPKTSIVCLARPRRSAE